MRPLEHTVTTAPVDQDSLAASDAEPKRRGLGRRLGAFFSRLSTRNAFFNKMCSLIWLPYAWRSGISMKRLNTGRFTAILPFMPS